MKRISSFLILLALGLSACGQPHASNPTPVVGNPSAATQPPLSTPVVDYAAAARGYVKALTDIGPRPAGTEAESATAKYIADALNGMGYSAETQPFIANDASGNPVSSANVVAVKGGKSAQEIIVGAHYDSVEVGKGADDNASGVAVMLEVANQIKNESTPFTIRFIAFGAEETGLLGSYAYVNKMSQTDFENTIAMINLDSLIAGDITYVYSAEPQAALRDWTLEWAFGNSLDLQTIHDADLTTGSGSGVSDFFPFQQAGIPFIYFEATNWNLGGLDGYTQVGPQYGQQGKIWHTPDDTLEYLDATFPGRVDQHLSMFVQILKGILTQYEGPTP